MTPDAAGMDIYADLEAELTIPSLGRVLIPNRLCVGLYRKDMKGASATT